MLKALRNFTFAGEEIKAGEVFNHPSLEAFFEARGLAVIIADPEPEPTPDAKPQTVGGELEKPAPAVKASTRRKTK